MKTLGRSFIALSLVLTACQGGSGGGSPAAPNSDGQSQQAGELPAFVHIKNTSGAATSIDNAATTYAFSYPSTGLTEEQFEKHKVGDGHFARTFSDDPNRSDFGLGPVFNNSSCIACHNSDGRGSLPVGINEKNWTRLGQNEAIFLRISIESEEILNRPKTAQNHFGAPVAVPGFSDQLFHSGTYQLREDFPGAGQALVYAKFEKSFFTYPDGIRVELSKPIFKVENPYDEVVNALTGQRSSRLYADDVRFSPRMGMPMFGLGLLEAVPDQDILDLAKVDHSAEGVAGKPNWVYDVIKARSGSTEPRSLGRFGLKGSTPSVAQQAMAALNGDMGVTNDLFPLESILNTRLFDNFVEKTKYSPRLETTWAINESLIFYSKTLAVPPRRNIDLPDVQRGGQLFNDARCVSCHVPSLRTGPHEVPSFANQTIYPFTDLLLHDMGEGLADHRQDYEANGRQWKTRALWGIGLTQVVNPRAGFLHDGRARTLEEAILWHDGEARYSRDRFTNLPATDRAKLLAFVRSL